jgi:hypothetical protein
MDAININFHGVLVAIIFNGQENEISFSSYQKSKKKLLDFLKFIFGKRKNEYKILSNKKFCIFLKKNFDDMRYFRLIKKLRKFEIAIKNVNINK